MVSYFSWTRCSQRSLTGDCYPASLTSRGKTGKSGVFIQQVALHQIENYLTVQKKDSDILKFKTRNP